MFLRHSSMITFWVWNQLCFNVYKHLLTISHIFIAATIDAYENGKLEALTRTINPGDKVDIPCSVVTPGGSVQWILNNKPILLDFSQNQRRHWNISNDGQASLTINRITRADEGLWECWELDSAGNVRQKAPIMRIVLSSKFCFSNISFFLCIKYIWLY